MAVRKPLVLIGGRQKMLPAADSIAAAWADLIGRPAVIGAGADQAAARLALGLGSAAVAPILGTVAQSSGVPTGSLFQKGSNANGSFVRLADGTQICWYVLNHASAQYAPDGQTQLAFTWTFPATFVSAPPYVDLTPTGGGSGYFNLRVVAPSASNAGTLYMINTSNGYQNCGTALRCIAIGRWF